MAVHGYLMSGQTAAWIRGQMERKAPSAAEGATRRVRPSVFEEDEFARPFEVRFAPGIGGSDSGKWIVWLPSDSMLIVNGETVSLTDGLDAAGSPFPAGWYVLDFLDEDGGDVFLNVKIPKGEDDDSAAAGEEEEVTAEFAATAAEEEDGYTVYPVKIAECSPGGVKATVGSAVVLGGGGSAGDCVTSLNDLTDDVDIIGGVGIEVEVIGQTIKITSNPEKEDEDADPNAQADPCAKHPGASGGASGSDGDGGGGVIGGGDGAATGGCKDCGGESTVGGQAAPGGGGGESGATGGVQPGAHGQESAGVDRPNGVEASGAPTSGSSAAGSGSSSSGSSGKPGISTMFGTGDTKKPIANTNPIYGGTHSMLTDSKKMNESPFKRK